MNQNPPVLPGTPYTISPDFQRLLEAMAECQADIMIDPADSLRIINTRIVPTLARVVAMMVAIDDFFTRTDQQLSAVLEPKHSATMSKGKLLKIITMKRDAMRNARQLLAGELERLIASLTPPVVVNKGIIL